MNIVYRPHKCAFWSRNVGQKSFFLSENLVFFSNKNKINVKCIDFLVSPISFNFRELHLAYDYTIEK